MCKKKDQEEALQHSGTSGLQNHNKHVHRSRYTFVGRGIEHGAQYILVQVVNY